tara:strand:+ start:2977 stop:3486 length:510 start_codon:yes stop_codon:yes gene_type:complete
MATGTGKHPITTPPIPEIIMNKSIGKFILTAAMLSASSFSSAQNLSALQALGAPLSNLFAGGAANNALISPLSTFDTLVAPLQSSTEAIGLNSSPLFNILPTNPLITTYSILLAGPSEAIIVGDLLQGTLIINGILDGIPSGTLVRQTIHSTGLGELPLPISGLINSQF